LFYVVFCVVRTIHTFYFMFVIKETINCNK